MADSELGESATAAPPPRWGRRLVLLGGLLGIVLWQSVFFRHSYPDTTLESPYRLEASGGVLSWQPEFVYFLYYLNLYPVATISESPLEYSVEGARRLIAERGETLVMDRYWTLRYGDLAKTYLYLPHVWLKGRPVRPRMTHANALGFTLALLALFAAFWSAERTLLGTLLVALIGSDPFQVHQVYANNNLFGWPITVTVLVLALHVPLMRDRPPRLASALVIALVSGLILGSVRQIRTEPVLVMASAAGVYLTATRLRLWLRLTLVVLLGAAFTWTSAAWASYFDAKYREAYTVVKAAGGHTYDGARHPYHFFWHAVWCGLGDLDLKYGYQWSDLSAIRYAWPVMQRRGVTVDGFAPPRPDELDSLTTGVYWDRGGQYARTPFELPEYIGVVRDKVLRDVLHDPWWFASIIGRRFARLVSEATPPSLALGNGWNLSLASQPTAELRRGRGDTVNAVASPSHQPLWGCATLLVSAWLIWRRAWFYLKLLAFTLPLTATAVIVYSGGGTAYYSIVHLVALAVVGALVWERLRARYGAEATAVDEHAAPSPIRSWRLPLALGLSGLLAMVALLAVVGRVVGRVATPASVAVPRSDRPAVAVMRFDNQTSNDSLAWVGDALGELFAAEVARAGGRVLDPEAVAWLDADLVVWGPSSILSGPRARVVNIVADRSGVERVVAGRVYQDSGGMQACVELLGPGRQAAVAPEHCERVDPERPLDTPAKLARAVLPALGGALAMIPGAPPGAANAFRFYTEARRSMHRQMWGKAARLLDRSLREDPGLLPARALRARLSSRWRPLAPDVLIGLTGTASVRGAVEVLRAEVVRSPLSIEARMDLGRVLIDLELFDETVKTLHPLLTTPGAPAEAFGLLATALASVGDLPRGYQALLEARRRSWQEPLGNSLMGAHLTRWGHLELATLFLNDAESERSRGTGAPPLVLDDLLSRWSIRALQDEWPQAAQLASQMLALDDPRAKGAGSLRLAIGYLLNGRSRLSGVLAEEAAFDLAQQHVDVSDALAAAVEVRLERNEAADALELVRRLRPTDSSPSGRRISYWEAIVLAELRQWPQADAVRGRLAREVSDMPGPAGRRLLHQLDGELRLRRGDASGALSALSEAAKLLPARGFCGDQVPLWYALGRANLAAGRSDQARTWLERVAGAANERLCWPIPYARSFLLLGRIGARTDQADVAVPAYRRFLRLWGEADFAGAERDEARRYLAVNEKQPQSASSPAEAQADE